MRVLILFGLFTGSVVVALFAMAGPVQVKKSSAPAAPTVRAIRASAGLVAGPAATIVVTSSADSGPGTLRQALADAQDGDTITFAIPQHSLRTQSRSSRAPTASQTITLTSGELVVARSVTIMGPGADMLAVTRDQTAPEFRIFHVTPGPTAVIQGLTISNGLLNGNSYPDDVGGGIYTQQATLTLTNCTVTGNGAIWGAGIYNDGESGTATLTLNGTTVSTNYATNYDGVGIYNDGESGNAILTLNNSVVVGNMGNSAYPDSVNNDAAGRNATLSLNSSSVSGNSSGIVNYCESTTYIGANATVTNSTVSPNGSLQYGYGGGIYNYGKSNLTLTNSTVSNNSAVAGGGIYNNGDVDHNLTATAASAKVASTSNSVHIS